MAALRLFCSFKYAKDRGRKATFLHQASDVGRLEVIDLSLDDYQPTRRWRRRANRRLAQSDLMVILLGADTHDAEGVEEEIRLAEKHEVPILQVKPQRRTYGNAMADAPAYVTCWRRLSKRLGSYAGRNTKELTQEEVTAAS